MKHRSFSDRWRDFIGILSIIAPIICLIDCILLPVVAVLLPFVSIGQVIHGLSDQVIAMVVFAICSTAIVPGYYQHKNKKVLFTFAAGISLLFFVSFLGEQLDQFVHMLLTLSVSFLLIKANLENKKLLACHCHGHEHGHEHGHGQNQRSKQHSH